MEEKELIKGKTNYNLIPIIVLSVVVIVCIIVLIKALSVNYATDYLMGRTIPKNGDESDYWFYQASLTMGWPQAAARHAKIALAIGIPSFIAALLLFFASNCSITLTDKKVFGKASFGKHVSIPLSSITSVSMKALNGLSISTFSGNVIFRGISNKEKFFNTISQLLIADKTKSP